MNASTSARMSGRLVLNGTTEIRGSFGEISGAHVSEATGLWLQTMVPLKRLEHIPNRHPPAARVISEHPVYDAYERTADEVNIIGRIRGVAGEI